MNKTYKLENKSVELTADEIRKLVKDNPEIMKEEKGDRYADRQRTVVGGCSFYTSRLQSGV